MNPILMAPTVLPEAGPVEYLEAAIAAEYEAIGLRLHRSLVMPFVPVVGDDALTARIRGLLRDSGVRVFEVTSFYLAPEMNFDEYAAAMELGAEFGGKIALVISADKDWPRMVERFGRLCEIAWEFGMTCAIENAPNGGLRTVQEIVKLIEETGAKNGAICLDPVNHIVAGGTPEDLRALPARYFPYTQFADAIVGLGVVEIVDGRQKHIPRRIFGDGNMDLHAILDALPANIPISLETPFSIAEELGKKRGRPFTPNEWAKEARLRAQAFLQAHEGRPKS